MLGMKITRPKDAKLGKDSGDPKSVQHAAPLIIRGGWEKRQQ
jgi:hypothetical protein